MEQISWQRWVTVCVVLILLGLAADYYFIHILFNQKRKAMIEETVASSNAAEAPVVVQPTSVVLGKNNFLESLKACRPDISSQGITTPEALLTYLEKSVGVESGPQGGNTFAQQNSDQANINGTAVTLNDGSFLTMDSRGSEVLSFELKTEDKTLTCKGADCACN